MLGYKDGTEILQWLRNTSEVGMWMCLLWMLHSARDTVIQSDIRNVKSDSTVDGLPPDFMYSKNLSLPEILWIRRITYHFLLMC